MRHEDLPVTCSASTLKALFFERAFNLTWVPCASKALRRFKHCLFLLGGLVAARLCYKLSKEPCESQWECVPGPCDDCCFSFLSPAPMEVLNKHNRILLYVENYRQIRSAGKRVRIASFILTLFFLPLKLSILLYSPSWVSAFPIGRFSNDLKHQTISCH